MKWLRHGTPFLLLMVAINHAVASTTNDPIDQWPQWRGPLGTGEAPHATPPVEWNEDKNIRWKLVLQGKGHSTPILWADHVFVTTAVPVGEALPPKFSETPGGHDETAITHRQRFTVLAIDRKNGQVRWERTVREDLPHQGGHVTASLASASPVTDGEHVYAFFGSYGLHCLSYNGKVIWQHDLGRMNTLHGHGEGSSPALHGETVIVNWDHEGDSFLVAFDKRTGQQRWKTPRPHATSSTTPIVVEHGDRTQVIVSGSERIRGYDLADGKLIWECDGLSKENVSSSPVAGHGMVFAGSTYDRPGMLAIRLEGARGDITATDNVVWNRTRGAPYVPSPLLYGDALWFLQHFRGLLTRVDARTGEDRPGAIRLPEIYNVFASPVAADGRVYVTSREGVTVVLADGDKPNIISVNHLADRFSASPALAGGDLFLRGEKFLYCIAEQ